MSRGPATFRQRDVERALKAARAAGYDHVQFNPATGVFEFVHNGLEVETAPGNFFDEKLKDDPSGNPEHSPIPKPPRQVADLLPRCRPK